MGSFPLNTTLHLDDLPPGLERIIMSSAVPMTLAPLLETDCPLRLANDKFCEMSGYEREFFQGKNCRFLQPKEGAGPVRARIRSFLGNSSLHHERFVLTNVRKNGERFLNLLYLSKLSRDGRFEYVLGSQFDINKLTADAPRLYDRALETDIRKTKELFSDTMWSLVGSFSALAESSVTIAQASLDHDE